MQPAILKERTGLMNRSIALIFYLFVGCLETILSYYIFDRTDDHIYFLDIANSPLVFNIDADLGFYNLKAQVMSIIYSAVTVPSRWLGNWDLIHILWLRIITLLGFYIAYRWVVLILNLHGTKVQAVKSQNLFMFLSLIYPGQLAWTSSMLRDGIASAAIFYGLYAFSSGRRMLSGILISLGILLRVEYVVLIACLYSIIKISKNKIGYL